MKPVWAFVRCQADLLEVDLLIEGLDVRLEADLIEDVAVVVGDGRPRVLVVGPDGDLLTLRSPTP